jgi:hypothetical protein
MSHDKSTNHGDFMHEDTQKRLSVDSIAEHGETLDQDYIANHGGIERSDHGEAT